MFIDKLVRILVVSSIYLVGIQPAQANGPDRDVRVMTYNMYLGTDFTEIFSSQSNEELISEVAEAYGDVQMGDPAERIAAIADQIEAAAPMLVGLQEVALWRTGNAFDPSPATAVSYDFLQMLLDEVGQLPHQPPALRAGHLAPGALVEGPARGADCSFDILFVGLGHLSHHRARGRVVDGECLA